MRNAWVEKESPFAVRMMYAQAIQRDRQYCYAYFHKAKVLSEIGRDDDAKAVLTGAIPIAKQAGDEQAHREMQELLQAL